MCPRHHGEAVKCTACGREGRTYGEHALCFSCSGRSQTQWEARALLVGMLIAVVLLALSWALGWRPW